MSELKPSRNTTNADGVERKYALLQSVQRANVGAQIIGRNEKQDVDRKASSTRNMNFFIDSIDHKLIRSHAIATNRSLQSIMAEALNLYLKQHGLGPIKLVKAYRV